MHPPISPFRRFVFSILRALFHFFFNIIPYAPIHRENRPDAVLAGRYIWTSSHQNYFCDVCVTGKETHFPLKFIAKHTLFRFPIKNFMYFCGGVPVVRAEEAHQGDRSQNRKAFAAAIEALEQGWSIGIYPEGCSLVLPGLLQPLKPGAAKLALAAEDASDFGMGLYILPVGLEYVDKARIGGGLYIRYGKPILVADFQKAFLEDEALATGQLMDRLSDELKAVFPHFENWQEHAAGADMVSAGMMKTRLDASLFFRHKGAQAKQIFRESLEKFKAACADAKIPLEWWGAQAHWQTLTRQARLRAWLLFLAGVPFAFWYLVNNLLADRALVLLTKKISSDETEFTTMRIFLAGPVLFAFYGLQWLILSHLCPGTLSLPAYILVSALDWYAIQHWYRLAKRLWAVSSLKRHPESAALAKELQALQLLLGC